MLLSRIRNRLKYLFNQPSRLAALEGRLNYLEARLYNRRWDAVEEMGHYLVGAQIPGDYCEFGVYRGSTFQYAARVLGPALPSMRFFGFDSFEGLPVPRGVDCVNGYTSNFSEGEFSASLDDVKRLVAETGTDMSKVAFIKGWYNESLNDKTAHDLALTHVAAAWIDCDLYESTVPVLDFLTTRLSIGSILLFDDWRAFRNLPEYGEQRACSEWLRRHENIELRELFSFGHHGVAFTVSKC